METPYTGSISPPIAQILARYILYNVGPSAAHKN